MIVVDHGRQVPRRSVGLARGAADAGPSHGLAVHCDRTPTLIDGQSRVDPGAQGQVEAVAVEASQHPPDRGLARRAASQPCPHCYLRGSACRRLDHLWVDVRPRRQAGRLSSGPALDLRPALGPARRGHQDTALAASAGHASPLRRRAPAAQDRPSRRARTHLCSSSRTAPGWTRTTSGARSGESSSPPGSIRRRGPRASCGTASSRCCRSQASRWSRSHGSSGTAGRPSPQPVYRKQLKPVLDEGTTAMDDLFPLTAVSHSAATEAGQERSPDECPG
jgi:hypothetical protein